MATTEASRETVLETIGVCVHYGGVRALDDVTIAVERGQVRGSIGPNGAGKSTLFDVIAGAQRPTSGRVRFLGADVTRLAAVRRSRLGIRRTFQRQQPWGWLTVWDNVLAAIESERRIGRFVTDALGLGHNGDAASRDRVHAALQFCGIEHLRDRPASDLSIGEARMMELARAIVSEPDLLLLDEPTSGLSEHEAERVGEVIDGLRATKGCTVVLVEHDIDFVMQLSDEVTVLCLGEVIFEGPPAAVRADDTVRTAYLGQEPGSPAATAADPATASG
jgi:branched-chain amino acid transport system ATP-binding protein